MQRHEIENWVNDWRDLPDGGRSLIANLAALVESDGTGRGQSDARSTGDFRA
jgi:hypothetical protein